ncbi:hypothetical protein GGF31_007498 [Allomyces arbusculus]|nr:hypothetical protein GGF31_007498 [Allomyces arbusculus]
MAAVPGGAGAGVPAVGGGAGPIPGGPGGPGGLGGQGPIGQGPGPGAFGGPGAAARPPGPPGAGGAPGGIVGGAQGGAFGGPGGQGAGPGGQGAGPGGQGGAPGGQNGPLGGPPGGPAGGQNGPAGGQGAGAAAGGGAPGAGAAVVPNVQFADSSSPVCSMFSPPTTTTGGSALSVLGCLQLTGGWACSADELNAPVQAPSCHIPNLNSTCMTGPFQVPPPAPGASALTVLGCLSPSSDQASLQCRRQQNLDTSTPLDANNNSGQSAPCLAAPLPAASTPSSSGPHGPEPTTHSNEPLDPAGKSAAPKTASTAVSSKAAALALFFVALLVLPVA